MTELLDQKKLAIPALGIDLGGTKIRAAAVLDNKILGDTQEVPTPAGSENIVLAILGLINRFQEKHVLAGVGIATAGIVDGVTGEVVGSTGNLPGWTGTPIKAAIESRILMPVHVENDANAAAYGEACARNLRHLNSVCVVTLGTGIGGGLIINGKLIRGANFGAGEVGHHRINLGNKRLCTCGLFDCWEAYGAGRGLVDTAKELLVGVSAEQTPLAAPDLILSTRHIVDAAKKGDIIARRALDLYHEHVAVGIVNLAHILNPSVFVITGGMADVVDFELLHELVVDRSMTVIAQNMRIEKSEAHGVAGIIGAAQLVLDAILEPVKA